MRSATIVTSILAVLLLVAGLLIGSPSFTGFFTFNEAEYSAITLNTTVTNTSEISVPVDSPISSFVLNGLLTGSGNVTIELTNGSDSWRVYEYSDTPSTTPGNLITGNVILDEAIPLEDGETESEEQPVEEVVEEVVEEIIEEVVEEVVEEIIEEVVVEEKQEVVEEETIQEIVDEVTEEEPSQELEEEIIQEETVEDTQEVNATIQEISQETIVEADDDIVENSTEDIVEEVLDEVVVEVNETNSSLPESVDDSVDNKTVDANLTLNLTVEETNITVNATNVSVNSSVNLTDEIINETNTTLNLTLNESNVSINFTNISTNVSANITNDLALNLTNVTNTTNQTDSVELVNQTNETSTNDTLENVTDEVTDTNVTSNSTLIATNVSLSNETLENLTITNQTDVNETNVTSEIIYTTFAKECEETCDFLPSGNLSLLVTIQGNVTVTLTSAQVLYLPVFYQHTNISDITLGLNQSVSLDLNDYFEGDGIYYDLPRLPLEARLNGSNLTLYSGDRQGFYEVYAFAVYEQELLRTNVFRVLAIENFTPEQPVNLSLLEQLNETILDALAEDGTVRVLLIDTDNQSIKEYENLTQEQRDNVEEDLELKNDVEGLVILEEKKVALENGSLENATRKQFLELEVDSAVLIEQQIEDIVAVEVNATQLVELIENGTQEIELDTPLSFFGGKSSDITQTTAVRNLGFSGSGQRVCIVDSGSNLPVAAGYNVIDESNNITDVFYHGTAVHDVAKTFAPNASFFVAKVVGDDGNIFTSDVLAGMTWCQEQNVSVVSLSLGEGNYENYCDDTLLAEKANELYGLGIQVVAATGNDGFSTSIANPSCASNVIRVSGSTKDDDLWSDANRNNVTLLVAPALDIITSVGIYSGTSMSAPMVSGALAVLEEAQSLDNLSQTVHQYLINTGDVITESDRQYTRLNTFNAYSNTITNNLTFGEVGEGFNTTEITLFAAPSVSAVTISPLSTQEGDDYYGFCSANDDDGDALIYEYDWFVEGSSTSSGFYTIGAVNNDNDHSCGILTNGSMVCWGRDNQGQIGNGGGDDSNVLSPELVSGSYTFQNFDTDSDTTCGILTNGSMVCWGDDDDGKLGDGGGVSDSFSPVIVNTTWEFIDVGIGADHVCAVLTNGSAACWGDDAEGAVGNGATTGDQYNPVLVDGGHTFSEITGGYRYTCALHTNGTPMCWGRDDQQQIGNGAGITDENAPVPVQTTWNFIQIDGGGQHVCGLLGNGSISCWGEDDFGQQGNGAALVDSDTPVLINLSETFIDVASAGAASCGILVNGSAYCWGRGTNGELGNGASSGNEPDPVLVDSTQSFIAIEGGEVGFCAQVRNGSAYCWGADTYGEIGDGTAGGLETSPVRVDTSYIFSTNLSNATVPSIDSLNLTSLSNSLISPSNEVILSCRVYDGSTYSSWVNSSTVIYVSTTPTANSASVEPTTIGLSDDIYGFCSASDADSDPLTFEYDFFINDVSYDNNESRMASISSAYYTTCALLVNGSITCWGEDTDDGQLGDGTPNSDQSSPTTVVDIDNNAVGLFIDMATTAYSSCGILENGTPMCWGSDASGRLGDGSGTTSDTPSPVATDTTWNFTSLNGGFNAMCGTLVNGSVACWGRNDWGMIGDGTTSNAFSPTLVNSTYNFSMIDTGYRHTCGLLINGSVMCWGHDDWGGELGNGGISGNQLNPGFINTTERFTSIGIGGDTSCGVLINGSAMCWGDGTDGKVGDGNSLAENPNPVVVNTTYLFKFVSSNEEATCGLLINGSVACWGGDTNSAQGNGAGTTAQATPNIIDNDRYSTITGAYRGGCGVLLNGSAKCWGWGARGKNGDGSTADNEEPALVNTDWPFDIDAKAIQLAPVNDNLISFLSSSTTTTNDEIILSCRAYDGTSYSSWVNSSIYVVDANLTFTSSGFSPSPPNASAPLSAQASVYSPNSEPIGHTSVWRIDGEIVAINASQSYASILASLGHSCGILTNGTLNCVGRDDNGQLGNGNDGVGDKFDFVEANANLSFKQAQAYYLVSCGVLVNGSAYCWGDNTDGAIGDGTSGVDRYAPTQVNTAETFTMVTGGNFHSCGILTNGSAMCWGEDDDGELGNGATTGDQTSPVLVQGGHTFKWISAGEAQTCAVHTNGTPMCWGIDTNGELGDGADGGGDETTPSAVDSTWSFTMVETGFTYSCGVLVNGSVACWGDDGNGQLGNGATTGDQESPVLVESSWTFSSVDVGGGHSCGLLTNGSVACWGSDADGRLGNGGTNSNENAPTLVNSSELFTQIVVGGSHTCALMVNGTMYCWGDDADGAIGNGGTATDESNPVAVNLTSQVGYGEITDGSSFTFSTLPASYMTDNDVVNVTLYAYNVDDTVSLSLQETAVTDSPPTTPTSLTCDGGNCNGVFVDSTSLMCSGSTDPNGDTITYVIEAGNETVSVDLGDGANGSLTVTGTFNWSVNDGIATSVTANPSSATLTVTSSSGFSAGDEVMLINIRGTSTDNADVGNYEFFDVNSVDSGEVVLSSAPTKSYDGTSFSDQIVVLQRVPNYQSVNITGTLTVNDYEGGTGGIIVFRANESIDISGTISADGKGFRGGPQNLGASAGTHRWAGESYGNAFQQDLGSNASSFGGGGAAHADGNNGGSDSIGVGGGGGYGTAGTDGTSTNTNDGGGEGGGTFGNTTLDRLYFGGAGGSGGHDTDNALRFGGAGGDSGGIVYLITSELTITGTVSSNGLEGETSTNGGCGGAGGAGGSIFLYGNTSVNYGSGVVNASGGGAGGNTIGACGTTGDGGSGRIYVETNSLTGTSTPTQTSGSPSSSAVTEYSIIGNHTASGSYTWTFDAALEGEIFESMRCRAIDLTGSNSYSSYYTESTSLLVDINTAPNATAVSIEPTTVTESSSAYGYCAANDSDNDTLIYEYDWFVDGSSTSTGFATEGSFGMGVSASCALLTNGSAACWGFGGRGQIGSGGTTNSYVPQVVDSTYTFRSVTAGTFSSFGVLTNGSGVSWGRDANNLLGDGAGSADNLVPDFISGNYNFTTISASSENAACGLLVNGTPICWGLDDNGMIGNGGGNDGAQTSPVVVNTTWEFTQIQGGTRHICGLLVNGTPACWGNNEDGSLGTGAIGGIEYSPVIVNTTWEFTQISLGGGTFTCGLLVNGTPACWGQDDNGQIGDGPDSNEDEPNPKLVNTTYIFSKIEIGWDHTCGLLVNGSVACWGNDFEGELGNGGTSTDEDNPVLINSSQRFIDLSVFSKSSCALTFEGDTYCWGDNEFGELGLGTNETDEPNPQLVSTSYDFSTTAFNKSVVHGQNVYYTQLASSQYSIGQEVILSCRVYDGVAYSSWINSSASTVSAGSPPSVASVSVTNTPINSSVEIYGQCQATDTDTAFLEYEYDWFLNGSSINNSIFMEGSLDIGVEFACALYENGTPVCWGDDQYGQLGTSATSNDQYSPVPSTTDFNFSMISVGHRHVCGILINGSASCWGRDHNEQLGNGAGTSSVDTPALVSTSWQFKHIASGHSATCGVLVNGSVACWGTETDGELGNGGGTTDSSNVPALIDSTNIFETVSVSQYHACGLLENGTPSCWGRDSNGQLGITSGSSDQPSPVITETNYIFKEIVTGDLARSNLGILVNGSVACWGLDSSGQCGDGGPSSGNNGVPDLINYSGLFTAISTGNNHGCAILINGSAMCWGSDGAGRLGDGNDDQENETSPIFVQTNYTFVDIAAGAESTCALFANGSFACWGADSQGRLGIGTVTTNQYVPVVGNLTETLMIDQYNQTSPEGYDTIFAYLNHSEYATDDRIILACRAYDGTSYSSWVNSSTYVVDANFSVTDVTISPSPARSDENLTITFSEQAATGEAYSAVDWRVDGTSLAYLNVPMYLDNTTTIYDISTNGLTGTAAGTGMTFVAGGDNDHPYNLPYMNLSGTNDYYSVGSFSAPDTGSIAMWLYVGTAGRIIGSGDSFEFRSDTTNGNLRNEFLASGASGTVYNATDSRGSWVHVVATWDSTTNASQIYINGSLADSNFEADDTTGSPSTFSIGTRATNVDDFTGAISQFMMFSRVLSAEQVSAIHEGYVGGNESIYTIVSNETVEGETWSALVAPYDSTGNGENGTSNSVIISDSAVPAVSSVTLDKTSITTNDDLYGFCEATDADLDRLTYEYEWFRNDVSFYSGEYKTGSVSVGHYHTCAIHLNGTPTCWGSDTNGGLGNGATSGDQNTPVPVQTDWNFTQLSVGQYVVCGVLVNGTGSCWGRDGDGELGNGGANSNSNVPVLINSTWNFSEIKVERNLVCGLIVNGSMACWGENPDGAVGDGTLVDKADPTLVNFSGTFVDFGVGGYHACGLLANGSIYCWGNDGNDQVGSSLAVNDQTYPILVESSEEYVDVDLGNRHTCAILSNGSMDCWGLGGNGRLGDGSTSNNGVPGMVDTPYTFIQAALADDHTCALLQNGTAMCWGNDDAGELGNGGTTGDQTTPDFVNSTFQWMSLNSNLDTSCGQLFNGSIYCWGSDGSGQVGDGDPQANQDNPVIVNLSVSLANSYATMVGFNGSNSSFAFLSSSSTTGGETYILACRVNDGTVYSPWVNSSSITLPNAGPIVSSVTLAPTNAQPSEDIYGFCQASDADLDRLTYEYDLFIDDSSVSNNYYIEGSIAGSMYTFCAILPNGTPECWGNNVDGQLGRVTSGSTEGNPAPVNTTWNFTQTASSWHATCGILDNGSIACWGGDTYGEVGDGADANEDELDPKLVNSNYEYEFIAAGLYHFCAVLTNGSVACWGKDNYGQLGNGGTETNESSPTLVNSSWVFTELTMGDEHTCGLLSNGSMSCWGWDVNGQLVSTAASGSGANPNPVLVDGTETFQSIGSGNRHTFGIMNNGSVRGGGLNGDGRVGDGSSTTRSVLVDINSSERFKQVDGGFDYTCGLLFNGSVYCWGGDGSSQLGDGADSNEDELNPIPISSSNTYVSIAVGYSSACAQLTNGSIECWGADSVGQLGDGDATTSTTVPVFTNTTNTYIQRNKTSKISTGTLFAFLDDENTTASNEIILSCRVYDGEVYSDWVNSSTLTINSPPVVNSVTLNATSILNITSDNLTVTIDSIDSDGDSITNITDWRLEGESIAVFRAPFDTDISDTSAGLIKDYSSLSLNGTLGGGSSTTAPDWVANCMVGGCYNFSGTDRDYIDFADVGNYTSMNYTSISTWVKSTTADSLGGDIISFGDALHLRLSTTVGAVFVVRNATGWTEVTADGYDLTNDEWHHIAASRNNTHLNIYINGTLVNSTVMGGTISYIIGPNLISGRHGNAAITYDYTGLIDELYVFNRSISSLLITELYTSGLAGRSIETIPFTETNLGENWSVAVTANDRYFDSTTILSNNLTILAGTNIAPSVSSVSILPTSSFDSDDLYGFCNATDLEVDVLTYEYDWFVNDVSTSSDTYKVGGVSRGEYNGCAILENGTPMCWGWDTLGALGDGGGYGDDSDSPTLIETTWNFSQISGGTSNACAVLVNGSVACWGNNQYGAVGDGSTGSGRDAPTLINSTENFTQVSGFFHTYCGLLVNGSVMCWGNDERGQLGDGLPELNSSNPVMVNTTWNFTKIGVGDLHACGIMANGSIACWGGNNNNQLGDSSGSDSLWPILVSGENTYVDFNVGERHTCALLANGSAECWGEGEHHRLGYGSTSNRNQPTAVNTSLVISQIIPGGQQTFAILINGSVLAWGGDTNGQLGDGTDDNAIEPAPILIDFPDRVQTISTSDNGACAQYYNGSIGCWGNDYQGQLGDGTVLVDQQNASSPLNTTETFGDSSLSIRGLENQSLLMSYLSASTTTIDDSVILSCRVYDGELYSDWVNSSTTSILNALPNLTSVTITGGSIRGDVNITISDITVSDADNDFIDNITDWRVDNISVALFNSPYSTNISSVASGLVRDYSSFGYNGTLGGGDSGDAPTWNPSCVVGGCYSFTASEQDFIDYGSTDSDLTSLNETTVMAWIRTSSLDTTGAMVVTLGDNLNLQLHVSEGPGFVFRNGTTWIVTNNSGYDLTNDQWHFLVGRKNSTHASLFINNTLVANQANTDTLTFDIGTDFHVGRHYINTVFDFEGEIDEVMIFNRSLSDETLTQMYQSGLDGLSLEEIPIQELVEDEVWSVAVTSTDGQNESETVLSNSITIENSAPVVTGNVLSATSSLNLTSDNLTLSYGVTDADADPITNITSWRVNGESIAVFQASFDTNISNTTSGLIRDYSTNGKNGTLATDTGDYPEWQSDCIVGGCYNFSRTDRDYIDFGVAGPELNFTSEEFSVAAWVKRNNTNRGEIVSMGDTYALAIDGSAANNRAYFSVYNGSSWIDLDSSLPGYSDNRWHHLVGIKNASGMFLYINGTLDVNNTHTASIPQTLGTNLHIGQHANGNTVFNHEGLIDEVYIFNRSISSELVSELFTAGVEGRSIEYIPFAETIVGENWSVALTGNDGIEDGTTSISNTLEILAVPVHTLENGTLNSTSGTNGSDEDLFVYFDSAGFETGNTNVTDWRVDGQSIAILNTPFNANVSITTTDAVQDYSSRGNDLTLGGGVASQAPTWVDTCVVGGCYEFNRSNNEYLVKNSTVSTYGEATSDLTLSAWIQTDGVFSTRDEIISLGDSYAIVVNSDGGLQMFTRRSSSWDNLFTYNQGLTNNEWHHVVGVKNSTHLAIYINGTLINSTTSTGDIQYDLGEDLTIGAHGNGDTNQYFDGRIDEVLVVNESFSAEQVQNLYQAQVAGLPMINLSSSQTTKDEVWQVAITPVNEIGDGITILSNSLTIDNGDPVVTAVSIEPALAYVFDDLYGMCSASDTDNDALSYEYDWFVDDSSVDIDTWQTGSMSGGAIHSCGVLANGSAVCWGRDTFGRLGDGDDDEADEFSPVLVNSTWSFSQVSVSAHSCGLLVNGSVACWGYDADGQLGNGATTANQYSPILVSSTWLFSKVVTGQSHSCGLLVNGSVACWGDDFYGQLGDGGSAADQDSPVLVNSTWSFSDVSSGATHSCGLLVNGSVACWGDDFYGQLGNGLPLFNQSNPALLNTSWSFSDVSSGATHSCGLLVNGSVACWGRDNNGQLGDGGSAADQDSPVLVNSTWIFSRVDVGSAHSCGLLVNGSVACWGRDEFGQLGDGDDDEANEQNPVLINSSERFSSLHLGDFISCGILFNGSSQCWGSDFYGELGDGDDDEADEYSPVLVNSSSPFATNLSNRSSTVFNELLLFTSLFNNRTSLNNQIILSCRVYDGELYSSWVNSSSSTVLNTVHTVENLVLNSSFATNTTIENLSLYYDSTNFSTGFTNITDWRVGGVSRALFYAPLDVRVDTTGAGLIRDYTTVYMNGTLGEGNTSRLPEWQSDCIVGGCYNFSRYEDDIINFGTLRTEHNSTTSVITMMAWVKANDTQDTDRGEVISFGDSIQMGVGSDEGIFFAFRTNASFWSTTRSYIYDISNHQWQHIVARKNGTHIEFFVNGTLINTSSNTQYIGWDVGTELIVGHHGDGVSSYSYDGLIDEVYVYNYSISDELIEAHYQAGLAGISLETMPSNETSVGETWQVAVTPVNEYGDGTTVLSNTLTIVNASEFPIISVENTFVNATNGHQFNVSATVNNSVGVGVITSTSVAILPVVDGSCSYASNSTIGDNFTVTYSCNGPPFESDSVSITFCNLAGNCNNTIYSANTYPNQVPGLPTLDIPVDGNSTLINRTVFFNWTASLDADSDPINYTINVTNAFCANYERFNLTTNEHTTDTELFTDFECSNNEYNWQVQACDQWNCSAFTSTYNFSIQDFLAITITNSTINFSTVTQDESSSTEDGTPTGFIFRNDGNIRANLTNLTSTSLWSAVGLDTLYFQYKANFTGEGIGFDSGNSFTTYRNVSGTDAGGTVIADLNYSDSADEAGIDINITVPGGEPSGNKTATINFVWESIP